MEWRCLNNGVRFDSHIKQSALSHAYTERYAKTDSKNHILADAKRHDQAALPRRGVRRSHTEAVMWQFVKGPLKKKFLFLPHIREDTKNRELTSRIFDPSGPVRATPIQNRVFENILQTNCPIFDAQKRWKNGKT